MSYVLGVDIGRTRCAAAVRRRDADGHHPVDVVALDGPARWLPTALFLGESGEVLVGTAAERAGGQHPDRLARGVLDRVGDDVPVLLGGELYPAENLVAAVVGWVVDVAGDAEGEAPERIAVTHPPEWGAYRRGLLHEALAAAGLPGVTLLPTVTAAAEAHQADNPLRPGSALAVTLLGGHRAEHALLRRNQSAFEVVAHHVTSQAGAALDDALHRHVIDKLGPPDDTAVIIDGPHGPVSRPNMPAPGLLSAFRLACASAKERLSVATEVRIPVPHLRADLTVTRHDFTELAAPVLLPALSTTRAFLAQASVGVIAGGTARIPFVAEVAPVLDDPATAAARGAALALAPIPVLPRQIARSTVDGAPSDPRLTPARRSTVDLMDEPPPRPPVEVEPLEPPPSRFRPRRSTR
ncbi:Hsp70 family protein [Actinokineospora inagensis]|uniref:Hsp70 family protein n=1 Tax=Actinokineospora inagensis TaxID=103730 RepID=UPI00041CE24B|nr:Hsp70 family protein [Actinokineospora inagensis]